MSFADLNLERDLRDKSVEFFFQILLKNTIEYRQNFRAVNFG